MNYYNEIKETLIKNEIYKKVKDYSKNKSDLNAYFEVGRLIVEAQGGEKRAKYGNKLIKEYSEKLTNELGKGYTTSALKRMRKFYVVIQKGATLSHQLIIGHYIELLKLKSIKEINYYIYLIENQRISIRELRERIKSNEYERIGYKGELKEPKINTFIKNPIMIKFKDKNERLYVNVNKNIKKSFHDNTVGVIICKKENKFVMEYCTNPKLFTTTYKTS